MDTILVSGGSGFIGKNFIELCLEKNKFNIIAYINSDDLNGISILKKYSVTVLTEKTLNQYDGVIDYALHLASYGVAYNARNVDIMLDVNIKLTAQLLKFCSEHSCKLFINTGSCFEYGTQHIDRPFREDDELKPEDIYAASKVACENFLRVYSNILNQKTITIRPFGIYGKYEADTRLMPLIFKAGLTNEKIKLTGGEQIRDYLDVKDVVKYIYLLFLNEEKIKKGECFNICSGNPISVKEFIHKIIEICNFDLDLFQFGELEYRKNESMYFVGSNEKLKKLIGNAFETNIETSILYCLEYYKRRYKGDN